MFPTLVLALLSAAQGPPETPPVLASLSGPVDEVSIQAPGDMLVFGGEIYLGGEDHGVAQALLIRDGRVAETGSLEALEAQVGDSDLTRIDLRGAVAVPGFQLPEVHALRLAMDAEALDLARVETAADLESRLADWVTETPHGLWVQGVGLRSEAFFGEGATAKFELSTALAEERVVLLDGRHNVAFLNTAALEFMGWSERLDQVSKSLAAEIDLDEEKAPTGWVRGEAVELVRARIESSLAEPERDRLLLHAQDLLIARGWTTIHDLEVTLETLAAYERLQAAGLLRLRVAAYLAGNAGVGSELVAARDRVNSAGGRLLVPGVAFRLDGSLESKEAALLTPYLGEKRNNGRLILTEESLTVSINDCYRYQLQPLVLAVGDRATRVAMRVIRTMSDVDESFTHCRPRVVGAQVVSTQDFPQFPGMNVYPTLRAGFVVEDVLLMETLLDSARLASAIEWNSLAPSLRSFAFQAELRDGLPDPLETLRLARSYERKSRLPGRFSQRGETLTGSVALRGLTLGPAAAVHEEELHGSLTEGSWADFTILSVDPLSSSMADLDGAECLMAVIAGQVVRRP